MGDTDRMPLEGLKRSGDTRHRWFRFDPTVSSGTLLQLAGIAVAVSIAYATYREDRATILLRFTQLEADVTRDRKLQETSFESFRGDVKELKTKMDTMSENIAVLKAQSTLPPPRSQR